ncbi:DUF6284 family protein [Streptomyces graminilatus]|uniref:DUF6284 family protein n=1 Tax=Streptomyces graminilatus TaxID=1464070 RepID=UPI0006E403EE|nr:DUF6284 family protein [Streptomyces graminilatus]
MKHIGAVQAGVTADDSDREPTSGELDAIETEMTLIQAEIELLDVQISLLDRPVTETDTRRLRRAHRKVLVARLVLANRDGDAFADVA